MKKAILMGLALPIVIGCHSEPQRYDDDKNNPAYWNSGSPAQAPYTGNYPELNPPPTLDLETAAVMGIVGAGALLALNRDYYKHAAITGRVVCTGQGKNDIEIPCGPLEVIITDDKGKELSRTQTESNNFAFRVKSDTTYHLRVNSKKYFMDPPETKALVLGDDIILRLSLQ